MDPTSVQTEDVLNELLCQWFVMSHIVLGFDQRLRLAVWFNQETLNGQWKTTTLEPEMEHIWLSGPPPWKSVFSHLKFGVSEAGSQHPQFVCGSLLLISRVWMRSETWIISPLKTRGTSRQSTDSCSHPSNLTSRATDSCCRTFQIHFSVSVSHCMWGMVGLAGVWATKTEALLNKIWQTNTAVVTDRRQSWLGIATMATTV